MEMSQSAINHFCSTLGMGWGMGWGGQWTSPQEDMPAELVQPKLVRIVSKGVKAVLFLLLVFKLKNYFSQHILKHSN